MECVTARQWIDMVPSESPEWETVDGEAVRFHVGECAHCREFCDHMQRRDQLIRDELLNVSCPAGLRERLVEQWQPVQPAKQGIAPSRQRWLRRIVGMGLSLALIAGGWYWGTLPSQFTTTQIGDSAAEMLVGRKTDPSAFDGCFDAAVVDSRWQKVINPQPVGWDLDERAGHDVAAYRINLPSIRFRGWLVVIPASRVSDAPTHSDPVRLKYGRSVVWRDQSFIYVCLAEQGAIEDLIDQRSGGAA